MTATRTSEHCFSSGSLDEPEHHFQDRCAMRFGNNIKLDRCVHADTPFNDPAVACNAPTVRKVHGWLCIPHYNEQSRRTLSKPRLPQDKYRGGPKVLRFNSDADIIRDIIRTEREAIQNGKQEAVSFGVTGFEKVILRYLQ